MTRIRTYQNLGELTTRLRDDLNDKELVLLYAYNRTGKTRLSMDFKDREKRKNNGKPDTLYFNAFTEDLFTWDNDLKNDAQRALKLNSASQFFAGLQELEMDNRIRPLLQRYADFDFKIDTDNWTVTFEREIKNADTSETVEHIKISRGEENIFIWCFFLVIAQLAIDEQEAYNWVKYIYIDDPISSLDDNNAISVACDLAKLLRRATSDKDINDRPKTQLKVIVSSHHSLFFNVMCNEIGRTKENQPKVRHKRYFLHRPNSDNRYTLRATEDTPYFHHVATLSELQKAADPDSGTLYTFHFNALRSIMEKTAAFFGHSNINFCIKVIGDDENGTLFHRALQLLSHGEYALYEPTPMGEDNQDLFRQILSEFIARFHFYLPEILSENTGKATP